MKGYIFKSAQPGHSEGPLSNKSMDLVLRRMKVDVTVHGMRSTFRDWGAETTNYADAVCEMALAHTVPNKAELLTGVEIS